MVNRAIKLPKSHSFFLFGARATGKSTLLNYNFKNDSKSIYLDLLNPEVEDRFLKNKNELEEIIKEKKPHWIIIDEIQKLPRLLNDVHRFDNKYSTRFALTGSSARKLKRGNANLLAGRAHVYQLYPLTHTELKNDFDLNFALRWGTLPKVYFEKDDQSKVEILRSYVRTYLKEEIIAEQIVRKVEPFRQFLEVAAQSNAMILNFSKIAQDVGVDTKTVQTYFQILEDTLIGYLLHPYHKSIRKRQKANPKFYYFDVGVLRALNQTVGAHLTSSTYEYGKVFETWLINEILKLNEYARADYRLSYLQTKDNAEIDLIVERPGMPTVAIEIKSKKQITERDLSGFERLAGDLGKVELYCFSQDTTSKKIGQVRCLHWADGLRAIGL